MEKKEFKEKLMKIEGQILNTMEDSDDFLKIQIESIEMNVEDVLNEAFRLIHNTKLFLED